MFHIWVITEWSLISFWVVNVWGIKFWEIKVPVKKVGMTNVQLIIIWAIDIAVNNVSVFDVLGINVWEINVRLWFYCHPPILEYLTVHCLLVFHVAVLIHPSISNSSSVQKHSACPNPPFKVTLPHLTNQYHTIALCQSCENLYFKVPNFDKLFLCGFSSRMSKILRRVVQTPQE